MYARLIDSAIDPPSMPQHLVGSHAALSSEPQASSHQHRRGRKHNHEAFTNLYWSNTCCTSAARRPTCLGAGDTARLRRLEMCSITLTTINPLRILLVDDSAEFLESAARLLMLHQE